MGAGGPPHRALELIRRDHPVSLHGVCMSIGGPNRSTSLISLRFRALVERYEPALVSEHLAWSTHGTTYFNDLLPLPYTRSHAGARLRAYRRRCRSDRTSDSARESVDLCRLRLVDDERDRLHPGDRAPHRLWAAARRQQRLRLGDEPRLCGARLPVRFSPRARSPRFISPAMPSRATTRAELLLIDSHDKPVADAVWKLYEIVISRCGPIPTLIEWDSDIPPWPILRAEATAAQAILDRFAAVPAMGGGHAA